MNAEIPQPSMKVTIIIREDHDEKLELIARAVRKGSGMNVSRSGVIDFLIASADTPRIAAAIARAKVAK